MQAYLGSEVELQVTVALRRIGVDERVLDHQRHLVGQRKPDSRRQAGRSSEVGKVLEGEGEGDGLRESDFHAVLGVVDLLVLPQGNGTGTDFTLARELDALLGALDRDCFLLAGAIACSL